MAKTNKLSAETLALSIQYHCSYIVLNHLPRSLCCNLSPKWCDLQGAHFDARDQLLDGMIETGTAPEAQTGHLSASITI